jgi:hypothetical protein
MDEHNNSAETDPSTEADRGAFMNAYQYTTSSSRPSTVMYSAMRTRGDSMAVELFGKIHAEKKIQVESKIDLEDSKIERKSDVLEEEETHICSPRSGRLNLESRARIRAVSVSRLEQGEEFARKVLQVSSGWEDRKWADVFALFGETLNREFVERRGVRIDAKDFRSAFENMIVRLYVDKQRNYFDKIVDLQLEGKKEDIDQLDVFDDFVKNAKRYGQVILEELYEPELSKLVLKSSLGGVAGGQKYIVHGLLLKVAQDQEIGENKFLYGDQVANHEFAMKGNVILLNIFLSFHVFRCCSRDPGSQ